MLERGLVSRILFPAPPPSYDVDSFPHDLIWVPKTTVARPEDSSVCPPIEDCVPCLLLTYPSARFLIIFFHSNAEDLGRCHGFCCYIRDQFQVHVLAVEYPGYGICPGVPSGETVMENAMAAMRFVTDTLQWPLDSIKVFGRSIGTGPAIGLASVFSLAGLVLVTPFLSVQDLFRDRVGPLASFVEEWFPNSDSAPKITSPTMIIHGQRDELISCRHGESIYELLRPRKLLISPPEMEHNTNLLTNLQFFVLPMFQFFALPDYAFQDLHVPAWAFDKRRSPFYIRPGIEISSHQLPNNSGKKKMLIPSGDDASMPLTYDSTESKEAGPQHLSIAVKLKKASEKALNGEAVTPSKKKDKRQLEPLFSSKDSKTFEQLGAAAEDFGDFNVAEEKPISAVKTDRLFNRDGGVSCGSSPPATPVAPSTPMLIEGVASRSASGGRMPRTRASSQDSSGSALPVTNSSEDVRSLRLSKVVEKETCSPEHREAIQLLEDFAGNLRAQEICSDELCLVEDRMDAETEQNMRRQEKALCDLVRGRQAQHGSSASEEKQVVAPRLLAAKRQGSQSLWSTWCTKQPGRPDLDTDDKEVQMLTTPMPQAPGLPPGDSEEADLPTTPDAWNANAGPSKPSSRRPGSLVAGIDDPESTAKVVPTGYPASTTPKGQGRDNVAKNPLWSVCCRPPVSDAPLSPLPRPPMHNEEDPIVPFGGRIISIAGSQQPMSAEEAQLRKNYPLGAPPEDISKGFQPGTRFAI